MVSTFKIQADRTTITDEEFEKICCENRDRKFERTAQGELVIMSLTGGETGRRNIKLSARLEVWSDAAQLGVAFDSSTGFRLPNGAIRSPDAAWISQSRWDALTPEQRKKWVPLCPDFVVELKSPSDDIADLQAKMLEYQENGLKLGWLIDPDRQIVEVYQIDRPVELLSNPEEISANGIMVGSVLKLAGILTT
jgi:Uma2 family endonuclease